MNGSMIWQQPDINTPPQFKIERFLPVIQGVIRIASSENTRRLPNAGLKLGQRRRRWPNFKPALGERLVFPWIIR